MEQAKTGMNKTGIQMSPMDTRAMLDAIRPGDGGAPPNPLISGLRAEYVQEADTLGSVPPPASAKGILKTAAAAMVGAHPQMLLDKLSERLAFERSGTRLYDALIDKVEALVEPDAISADRLREIRDQEAEHFHLVAEAIKSLGGDPTVQTPCADLVGVESSGLIKVVTDPRTSVVQSLHSILVAELTDNAGWEILIAMASEQGHNAMAGDFTVALDHEREHLAQVRTWVEESLLNEPLSASGPLH